MKNFRTFGLCIFLGLLAVNVNAMEELDEYFTSPVQAKLKTGPRDLSSLNNREIEDFYKSIFEDDRVKNCVVQQAINMRIKNAKKAKQNVTILSLVVAVLHSIFGCNYPINEQAKKTINDAIEGSPFCKPFMMNAKKSKVVVWYIAKCLYNLYLYEIIATGFWLRVFAEDDQDDAISPDEHIFLCNILESSRISALMREECMICCLFKLDKKSLIEMVQEVLFKIKLTLPFKPDKRVTLSSQDFDRVAKHCHSMIAQKTTSSVSSDKKMIFDEQGKSVEEPTLSKEEDKQLIALANRFNHLTLTSQAIIDHDNWGLDQLLKDGDSSTAFYTMLTNGLLNFYKNE